MFDAWPEAVLALREGCVVYLNGAARTLFPGLEPGAAAGLLPPPLRGLTEPGTVASMTLEDGPRQVRVSRTGDTSVLMLSPPESDTVSAAFLESLGGSLRQSLGVLDLSFGFLRPYLENLRDEKLSRYCATLSRSYFSMLRLAEGLQRLADLAEPSRTLGFSAVEMVSLAGDLTETVAVLVRERDVNLSFESDLSAAFVQGDAGALEQMLLALLSNSLKATPPGGRITVSVAEGAAGVLLTVRDTGTGIPPEKRSRVLRSPRQETGEPSDGVGLGLPLVQRCAALHGGSVILESQPGRGTCVTVCLPPLRETRLNTPSTAYRTSGMRPILTALADLLDLEAFYYKYSDD